MVKQLVARGVVEQQEYRWYEMGFFTKWISPGSQIAFCLDVPQTLCGSLQTLFLSPSTAPKISDIYWLHAVIIDEIIRLYDKSVWSLRDIIRVTELVMLRRSTTGKTKVIDNIF